ncbi:MAG: response regulator [Betaproteobacteria bacterium]|nr:response regulator [Betaproteobacteria bacterium]
MISDDRVSVFSSENRANIPVYPLDVFTPTDLGNAQIQGGTTRLPAVALEVLVLLDGHATVGDVEQRARHIPPEALRNLFRSLLSSGLVRAATIEESAGLDFSAFFDAAPGAEPSHGASESAQREATEGEPQLERHGYYVSIARQAVKVRKLEPGARLSVLVVEDDTDMANLVSRLLEKEGFEVEVASCRDEILARLRRVPAPDAVILDVMLPDVNGFDVLQRLKSHPALKIVPVIMLTADAKRESVMRGLVGGADGYITKPFERSVLVEGVKAVLGIAGEDHPPH